MMCRKENEDHLSSWKRVQLKPYLVLYLFGHNQYIQYIIVFYKAINLIQYDIDELYSIDKIIPLSIKSSKYATWVYESL